MKTRYMISLLLLAVTVTGCSRDMRDLDAYVDDVLNRQAQPIDPLPQIKPYETFEYTAFAFRDPFQRGTGEDDDDEVIASTSGPRPDRNRRREALEAFELDGLQMVGTLVLKENEWGLIKDPEGLIHRVQPANYVGRNHGRITGVYEDRIDVVELIADGGGGWMEREASIALDDE